MEKINQKAPKKYDAKVKKIYQKFYDFGIRISDVLNRKTGNPVRNNLRLNKHKKIVIIDYANIYKVSNNGAQGKTDWKKRQTPVL